MLWLAGETGEAVLLELESTPPRACRRGRRARRAARWPPRARPTRRRRGWSRRRTHTPAVAHLRAETLDPEVLGRLHAVADGIEHELGRALEAMARLEAPMNANRAAGERRSQSSARNFAI